MGYFCSGCAFVLSRDHRRCTRQIPAMVSCWIPKGTLWVCDEEACGDLEWLLGSMLKQDDVRHVVIVV